jgi:hypothetical protein
MGKINWLAEWKRTSKISKWFFYVWGCLLLILLPCGIVSYWPKTDDIGQFIGGWCIIVALKGFIPFCYGVAVRRRGGKFGEWVAFSVILGWFLPLIAYFAIWNRKPVLPQFRDYPAPPPPLIIPPQI